jgi:trimeric autotransporter adhesin
MSAARISLTSGPWRRGLPVVAVLALAGVAALAGAGQASAAPRAGHEAIAGTIATVAGGVGGPGLATTVALSGDCGVSFGAGSLYIADGPVVRQVSPQGDGLVTPAGAGEFASNGAPFDGQLATAASFVVCWAQVDHSGNLIIADDDAPQVGVVAATTGTFYGQAMTAGHVYAIAGTGTEGYSGDGGPARKAELGYPGRGAIDSSGNVVITDRNRVRVVAVKSGTFYGVTMTAGDIYTVAGNGTAGYSGDGGPATSAELSGPLGVAVDGAGNLVIGDTDNERIRVVAATTGTFYGQAMTAGHIYTVAGTGQYGYSGDSGPATSAELDDPEGVAVDGAGNLVIADVGNERVRVVAVATGTFYGQAMTAGDIYTVAGNGTAGDSGDGGPATRAELNMPEGVAVDGAGDLIVADRFSSRVRVIAASTGTSYGQVMTAGDIYTVAGNGANSFSGDGGLATKAQLSATDVAVDSHGNEIISDPRSERVRVVAAATGTFYGQAMTAGDIYTVAGDGTAGFSGDGGPATSAELSHPAGVAVDRTGNLLIAQADYGRIRVVAAKTGTFYRQAMTAGDIYTVAGGGTSTANGVLATQAYLLGPDDVTVDSNSNLVIADGASDQIRVVADSSGTFYGRAMKDGRIYTVAGDGEIGFHGNGGLATHASLWGPGGVAVDQAGNLVIADVFNDRIRVVADTTGTHYGIAMTAGHIYSVAGDGIGEFSGDGGRATKAALDEAQRVVMDSAGNLVIADTGNNRVRVVAVATGTFYGQAMTAGDIYTVAGGGTAGFSGDGGPATSAELNGPSGAAVTGTGSLLIADNSNNRLRMVTEAVTPAPRHSW